MTLAELRADCFKKQELAIQVSKELKKNGFSVIGTIRWDREGGRSGFSESERAEKFGQLIPFVDAIDIELESKICSEVIRNARAKHKTIILSFHDFKKTPPMAALVSRVKQARRMKADVIKIAVCAKSKDDVSRLMEFMLKHRDLPMIVIAMGNIGKSSRVLFPLLGSLLTYGYVGKRSAPGQFSAEKLAKAFQFSCC